MQTDIDLRYLMTAIPNGHVWHRAFFLWVRAQGCTDTCPAFPKMPMALSAFPILGAPQVLGNKPHLKGVKAWGEGPLRLKEISMYRDTLSQIRATDNTAGRSATRHLERCRTRLICSICWPTHPTGKCGTRPFFGGSGRRAVAHTHPAFPKNAYGPVGIPLIRGASGTGRLTQPSQRR